MIAREERLLLGEGVAEMVRGVAWRVYRGQGPAGSSDPLTVAKPMVRDELVIGAFLAHRTGGGPRAMRAEGEGRGSGHPLQRRGGRRMIAMGVGDKDVAHPLP